MKIRNGFVSNSSSSSFICCYATIVDEAKATEYLEKSKMDYEILTTEEALKKKSGWNDYGCDWAGCWVDPKIHEDKDYKYLVFESCGGAGDGDHDFDPNCTGDYNYSVYFDDFWEAEFISGIDESTGFADVETDCGAGRNG